MTWDDDSLIVEDDEFIKFGTIDKYLSVLKEEYLDLALKELKEYEKIITISVMAKFLRGGVKNASPKNLSGAKSYHEELLA